MTDAIEPRQPRPVPGQWVGGPLLACVACGRGSIWTAPDGRPLHKTCSPPADLDNAAVPIVPKVAV